MSPGPRIWAACRSMAIRSRPLQAQPRVFARIAPPAPRFYSDDATNQPSSKASPSTNTEVPESSTAGDGAAAQETQAMENPIDRMDDAALEEVLYGGRTGRSNQEGALSEAQEEVLYRNGTIPSPDVAEAVLAAADSTEALTTAQPPSATSSDQLLNPGHKFELPSKPYPDGFNVKKRYHPVLEQITRLMMRDGKLSTAQRNMAMVMNYLRTAPAPIYSPKYPLLPGTPPASHLPLNPVLYITIAIDSVAPLVRNNKIANAGGGGRPLEMPAPMTVRQRRRQAFAWLLDACDKKPSKGSGRKQFPHRVAEEIIAVVEGRSGVWDRRKLQHKQTTTARGNIGRHVHIKKRANR